jgi:hypothetical protein
VIRDEKVTVTVPGSGTGTRMTRRPGPQPLVPRLRVRLGGFDSEAPVYVFVQGPLGGALNLC